MKKRVLLIFFGTFLLLAHAFAQQTTVTGKVTSPDGPLPGVSVKEKTGTTSVSTDANGVYSIKTLKGNVLIFSYVGYVVQEQKVGSNGKLNVVLEADSKGLNEVVVVGYGTQKKSDLTGAVSVVDTKVLQARAITDVGRGLQGVVPGLSITTTSGALGVDPKITLRGVTGSLNSGGAQPLILLDNVEIPSLQLVNPDDVESISVLKDAASASIYGTRAAWGVVLITSKSGKKNRPTKISYTDNFSWSTPVSLPQVADGVAGAEYALSALQRTNPNTTQPGVIGMYIDSIGIEKMRQWEQTYGGQNLGDEMVLGRDFEVRGGKLFFYRPWNAEDKFLEKWSPRQSHNLSVGGGSESTSYNLGLGYLNQNGFLKVNPDEFNRYNISASINTAVNSHLDVRGKMFYTNTLTTTPFNFSAATYGPFYYLTRWPAYYPYGTYQGEPFKSAVTETAQANMNKTTVGLSRIQVGATLKPFAGFTVDADYTYSSTNTHFTSTGGATRGIDFWSGGDLPPVSANYQTASNDYTQVNSTWSNVNTGKAFATYIKNINDHALKFILGGDIEYYQSNTQYSQRYGLVDPGMSSIAGATGNQFVTGPAGAPYNSQWATEGAFARINYSYKNRYLLEVNGRFDGSSRFPTNKLWGFFPSVSAGWIVSDESFMKPIVNTLSFFKLRGSYGSIGNQDVGAYRFLSIMTPTASNWLTGGTNQPTISTPSAVSPTLSWETVTTFDLGLDARFFKNAFGVTFDWYKRTTTGMLSNGVTLPATFGTTSPVRNYGAMQTNGWELALDYNHTFGNGLKLNLTGTLSDFQDKITKYANTIATVTGNYEGKNVGEIWGYETDRFFSADDFSGKNSSGNWVLKPGVPSQSLYETASFKYGPGDIKYRDLNGDGVINYGANTVTDHGDLKVIGNSTPRYQYGFRVGTAWKGFDFDIFLQGVGKRELWASGPLFVAGWNPIEASYSYQMNYWTPTNTNAYYPRPTNQNQSNNSLNFLPQTKYLLNMAYLRGKNITLGYTLPNRLTSRVKLDKVRFYVSGENVFTIAHVGIPIDPAIDYTPSQTDQASFGRTYPYSATYSFGIQLTL